MSRRRLLPAFRSRPYTHQAKISLFVRPRGHSEVCCPECSAGGRPKRLSNPPRKSVGLFPRRRFRLTTPGNVPPQCVGGHPFGPPCPMLRRLAPRWLILAHPLPRAHQAATDRYDRTSTWRFRILRCPTRRLAANSRSSRRKGNPRHVCHRPRSMATCLPPGPFFLAALIAPPESTI